MILIFPKGKVTLGIIHSQFESEYSSYHFFKENVIVLPRETCCHNDLIEHVTCGDLKKFPKLWCSGPTTKQFVITYGFIPTNPGRYFVMWHSFTSLDPGVETLLP